MSHRERDPRPSELLLQRYVDGELRASERLELEAMLESDAELRRELDAMQAMRGLFADARAARSVAPLGLDFADRVWAQAREESEAAESASSGMLLFVKRASLVAASILFLLGAALWTMPTERASELGATPQAKRALLRELESRSAAMRAAERREAARREAQRSEALQPGATRDSAAERRDDQEAEDAKTRKGRRLPGNPTERR